MLSKCYTFGCGQGATKAMIQAIKEGVLDPNYCRIVNSTSKDIPKEYLNKAIVISEDPDAGCGKVREAAKVLMLQYIKDNPNAINDLIDETIDYVNIITTTEGASGSGASVILAKYISQSIEVPVNIVLITGFESDTRGLQNTINYFKDLNGADYTIRIVSNKKYLENSVTTFAAEEKANHEVASVLAMVQGKDIVSSDHNIDNTDHYRIITTPGLMFTGEVDLSNKKYKNVDQSNKDLADMVDYSSSLDFTPSATKIGIYMNISDNNLENIDTTFEVLKKKLCGSNSVPELFIHRQDDDRFYPFIRVIASGIDLPTEEVQQMYNKYKTSVESADNRKSDFFDALDNMDTTQVKTSSSTPTQNNDDFFKNCENEVKSEEAENVLGRRKRRRSMSSSNNNITNTTTNGNKENKFRTPVNKEYSEDTITKSC